MLDCNGYLSAQAGLRVLTHSTHDTKWAMTERPEPTEPMNPALRGATTDSSQSERDVSGLSGPKATDASERPKSKDIWDKIDVVGKLLGSILIPIGIAIAGFAVNIALQDRAAKQKTSEIAVTILQSRDPATPELRTWALGVFNNRLAEANQKLPAAAQKELDKNPLPSTDPTLGRPGPGGPPLGEYNADPGETTVSGVSAGAFMAVHLGIAFSS